MPDELDRLRRRLRRMAACHRMQSRYLGHARQKEAALIWPLLFELSKPRAARTQEAILCAEPTSAWPMTWGKRVLAEVLEAEGVPAASILAGPVFAASMGATHWSGSDLADRAFWGAVQQLRLILSHEVSTAEARKPAILSAYSCYFTLPPAFWEKRERLSDLALQTRETLVAALKRKGKRRLQVLILDDDKVLANRPYPAASASMPSSVRVRALTREQILSFEMTWDTRGAHQDRLVHDFAEWLDSLLRPEKQGSRGRVPNYRDATRWWALHAYEGLTVEEIALRADPENQITSFPELISAGITRLRKNR